MHACKQARTHAHPFPTPSLQLSEHGAWKGSQGRGRPVKLNAFVPVELGLPADGGGESVGADSCDDGGCGKDASGGEGAQGANQDGDHVLACVCSYATARWWQTEGAKYVACLLMVSAGAPAAADACPLFLIDYRCCWRPRAWAREREAMAVGRVVAHAPPLGNGSCIGSRRSGATTWPGALAALVSSP